MSYRDRNMKSSATKSGKQAKFHLFWILGILALAGILFLIRGLYWLLPAVIIPATLITLFVWATRKLWFGKFSKTNKILSAIKCRFQVCDGQITKLENDLEEIDQTMNDLRDQLKGEFPLSEEAIKETNHLLSAFSEEKEMRLQKIEFFKSIKEQIMEMIYKQEVNERLKDKRKRLSELRAEHLDDLAEMEALRHNIAFDQANITTLQKLQMRMACTNKLEKVTAIRAEFESLMREIKS